MAKGFSSVTTALAPMIPCRIKFTVNLPRSFQNFLHHPLIFRRDFLHKSIRRFRISAPEELYLAGKQPGKLRHGKIAGHPL